ncbi:hypothetical protein CsSME_00019046 [Camellia sinensis var. sinensis]
MLNMPNPSSTNPCSSKFPPLLSLSFNGYLFYFPLTILNSKPPTPNQPYPLNPPFSPFPHTPKPQNPPPSQYFKNPTTQFFHRPISLSAQFKSESISNQQTKKPLHVLFKEAVGLSQKIEPIEAENEPETNELKKRLKILEEEVRRLKENSSEKVKVENLKKQKIENDESSSKSLYALFANKGGDDSEKSGVVESLGMEDQMVYKELSLELALFVKHVQRRYAAEKFGKDNQEIVKAENEPSRSRADLERDLASQT